jgi:hypothetical protein
LAHFTNPCLSYTLPIFLNGGVARWSANPYFELKIVGSIPCQSLRSKKSVSQSVLCRKFLKQGHNQYSEPGLFYNRYLGNNETITKWHIKYVTMASKWSMAFSPNFCSFFTSQQGDQMSW